MGKSGLSTTERAIGKKPKAIFAKRKRNRAIYPNDKIMRKEKVKVGEGPLWREKRESKGKHGVE